MDEHVNTSTEMAPQKRPSVLWNFFEQALSGETICTRALHGLGLT